MWPDRLNEYIVDQTLELSPEFIKNNASIKSPNFYVERTVLMAHNGRDVCNC